MNTHLQRPSQGIVPGGQFLGNDSPHNFERLAGTFFEAARFTNEGFSNRFEWPTFFLAFQSLELYLKSYLLRHGSTLDYVKYQIGHDIQKALAEAKNKGLSVSVSPALEKLVLEVGQYYRSREFQYSSVGQWGLCLPDVLIGFVDRVRIACGV